ncbi:MAG TPA: copper resistance protein CopC [Isosphaeraceae bacterium]|jgi:methionine-rich copper-binding protein CopC|nr:copper resistance protein CopC [Isosphaeraceae bacterium]
MSHATRNTLAHKRRPQLRFEQLESRLLCAVISSIDWTSGAPGNSGPADTGDTSGTGSYIQLRPFVTEIATNPASGTLIDTAPQTLTLTFDRPVDQTTMGNDIELYKVASDGSLASVVDNGPAYSEAFDTRSTKMTVTLNQTLAAGHYQLFFSPISSLMGLDGSMLSPDATVAPLSDFSVAAPGMTVSAATPLGTLSTAAAATTVSGTLNLATSPAAVQLYQVILPDSQPSWRLGLEVTAERDGSALDSALALFDSHRSPIAAADLGRRDFPADPYLFANLKPGTYYIGVSGEGNLPGKPGGYDLHGGTAGTVVQHQAGGAFTLHLQVDAQTKPISLLSFSLDHADPLSSSPTGLTLQFSGALGIKTNTSSSLVAGLSQTIEVVDQSDRVWPVMVSGYSEANASISFLFNSQLPQGHYRVLLPQHGGLSDLTGQPASAPGQAAGVLGMFSVNAAPASTDPHNLGSLLPATATSGVSQFALLNPGDSVTYRFVITYAGYYALKLQYAGSPLAISITGPSNHTRAIDTQGEHLVGENLTAATPGVYFLRLTASGSQPVLVHLNITLPQSLPDSLLANGIGQGPALNLMLIAPTVLTPGPSPTQDPPPTSMPDAPPMAPSVATLLAPIALPSSTGGGSVPSMPPSAGTTAVSADSRLSILVTLGGSSDFIGRPSSQGNKVAAVGPGDYALASSQERPPLGIMLGGKRSNPLAGRRSAPRLSRSFRKNGQDIADSVGAPTNGAMLPDDAALGSLVAQNSEAERNGMNLANESIAQQYAASAQSQADPASVDPSANDPKLAANMVAEGEADADTSPGSEQASLSSPLGVGLIAAIVMHYRRQIGRWVGGKRKSSTRARRSRRIPAPHRPPTPV